MELAERQDHFTTYGDHHCAASDLQNSFFIFCGTTDPLHRYGMILDERVNTLDVVGGTHWPGTAAGILLLVVEGARMALACFAQCP